MGLLVKMIFRSRVVHQFFFVSATHRSLLVLCDWQFKWHGVISDPGLDGWSILKRRGENGTQKTMHFCCEDTFALHFIKLPLDFCRHQQLSKYCQNVSNFVPHFIANWTWGIERYQKCRFLLPFNQPYVCVHTCACLCRGVCGCTNIKRKDQPCANSAHIYSFCAFIVKIYHFASPLQSLKKCLESPVMVQNLCMLTWFIALLAAKNPTHSKPGSWNFFCHWFPWSHCSKSNNI